MAYYAGAGNAIAKIFHRNDYVAEKFKCVDSLPLPVSQHIVTPFDPRIRFGWGAIPRKNYAENRPLVNPTAKCANTIVYF